MIDSVFEFSHKMQIEQQVRTTIMRRTNRQVGRWYSHSKVRRPEPVVYGLSCLALMLFAATSALAGPVLDDPEGWTNAPSLEGWSTTGTVATADNPGTGGVDGGSDGYFQITFAAQGGFPDYEEDTIYTDGADYTGNYQNPMYLVTFSFLASNEIPLSSVLYFHSAVSTSRWEYAFSNTVVGSWVEHEIRLDYDYGWAGPGGSSMFWNDLANIDWIGINVARKLDTVAQIYGLDNWQLTTVIPEPSAICILVASFLSLAVTFRKRLNRELVV